MGGLERQILEIAKMLSNSGFTVFIITLDSSDAKPFYSVPNSICIIPIKIGDPDLTASLKTKLQRQLAMRKIIREIQPVAGIAFMFGGYLMSRFAMFASRAPLILAERNSPTMYEFTKIRKIRYLLFLSMIFAKRITVQFESYKYKYPKYLQKKIIVVPNSILDIGIVEKSPSEHVRFVYAGRFSFQKQVIRLLEGYSIFIRENPNTTLKLYGEGEQFLQLRHKIEELQIDSYVSLLPATEFKSLIQETDALCLLSKWEGFPNIVAESLMAGIPVVGFSNCDGVSDLVQDGVNGWLEHDSGELSEVVKLLRRAQDGINNKKIDKRIIRQSVQKYSDDIVFDKWLKLIAEIEK